MSRIPNSWKWALTAVIVAVAATVALGPRDGSDTAGPGSPAPPAQGITPALRAASGVADCPPEKAATGGGPLADLVLTCLSDGAPAAPGRTGQPTVLNLWAYWCEPCRTELPLFQEYADRAGSAVRVLTVHSDPDEAKALSLLAALNDDLRAGQRPELRLPGLQDSEARVRAAANAPAVLPITVLVRPDGSIADYVARPFHDAGEIAAGVAAALGVTT